MDSDRFDKLSDLFDALRDLPADERRRRLESEPVESDLRAAVERLLAKHDGASPLDEDGPGVAARDVADAFVHDAEALPARIGPHRVVRRIGEGGMGVVYEIEQDAPRRRAAAKVVKRGMSTDQFIARFESERQTLAMMEHPSIAQVLSAGATDDGRPYFVMEYVDGVQLLDHCDAERLSTNDRLRLFIKVCEAIEHAHQKGVIHRDIKPSNVLVTRRDDAVQVKVIDFGIARVYSQDAGERTRLTQHGQIVGTPMYMSPEQAEQRVKDIDTRSDIYSLGVLLYELLSGATPFDEEELSSLGYSEMLRVISSLEPSRPSTRCDDSEHGASRSAQRRATPEQLRSTLTGDLDWIVMKCLEKEPSRRYSTTRELAADLTNHLESRPVLAGPQSRSYRVRKYIGRNRTEVLAAASILLILVLGIVATSISLVWALNERTKAERASRDETEARLEAQRSADAAAREAATAEAVVSFLIDDLLGAADPARAADRDLSVRDAVHAAAEAIEGRFAERPAVEARIRNTIAHTLTQLGAFAEAEPQLRREQALLADLEGETSEGALAAQQALVTNLMQQSRFADAIELGREQLARIELANSPYDELRLAALGNLGVAHLQLGLYAEATPILEDTLTAKRRTLGDRHQSTLTSIHNLAGLYGQLGKHERSLELSREAYEGRVEVLGPGDPRTFRSLNLISWMLRTMERFDEVDALLAGAIADAEERLGPDHESTIELTKTLALQHLQRENFSDAEEIFREVLATQRRTDPHITNISTLSTILNLSKSVFGQGRVEEAAELVDEITPRGRELYPPQSWELGMLLFYRGRMLTAAGRYGDAEQALLESHTIFQTSGRGRAEDLRLVAEQLGTLFTAWHASTPEEGYDERAAEWNEKAKPPA